MSNSDLVSGSKYLIHNIGFKSYKDICDYFNINFNSFSNILKKYHKSPEEAVDCLLSPKDKHQYYCVEDKVYTQKELCSRYGISPRRFRQLRSEGLSANEIVLANEERKRDWASNHFYETVSTPCGLKAELIGVNGKNVIVKFEDGCFKETRLSHFKDGTIPHPLLKIRSKEIDYHGFKAKYITGDDDGNAYYKCTCQICGRKDILTPQQMIKGCECNKKDDK